MTTELAQTLKGFGGLLRCTVCGREQELGDISLKLSEGWPRCHSYTMTWLTAKQLAESAKEGEG